MKLLVTEIEEGVGQKKDKTIQIRLSGDDIKFVATEYSISLFVDEDLADKISFHLQNILQDRDYRRNPKDIFTK